MQPVLENDDLLVLHTKSKSMQIFPKTRAMMHAYYWEGSISRRLSQSLPGAAKEVSATTGKAGAQPARLAVLPVSGAFVKGGSEDT